MRGILVVVAAALLVAHLPAWPAGAAGEAVVAGEFRVDATFRHIGVVWSVSGDTDLDSAMTLEFRRQGTTSWSAGAMAMRAYPGVVVDGAPLGIDSWAASAMFLEPGTTYELRLALVDPDGGSKTTTTVGTTRVEPEPGPSLRRVVPGSGGGTGTTSDPFRGLQAAVDAAIPGDTLMVAAGTYQPFEIATSGTPSAPITIRGPGDGTAVVDGGDTDRGVVTIGTFDRPTAHLILEGLTIRNGAWGVDAQNTQDVVIAGNEVVDVSHGIINRRGDDLERNQTVCDNVVVGRTAWPGSGIPDEQGIDLRGWGNVVCHNLVRSFGDCISVEPRTGPSYGNDVYGNDVSFCVDDGIEVDYNQANVRVWRNRVVNARMGVSVQPVYGGPAYIFRNELFNLEGSPIKLNNLPSGVIAVHNTSVQHGNGLSGGSAFNNAVFRNNLFLGTRYAFEFTTIGTGRDFDFDAWGTSRLIDPGGPWFKWDDVRYDDIGDLPAGVEDHGVEVGFSDLVAATLPAAWDVAAPGGRDLRPVAGSAVIDAGATLPNLNDTVDLSGAPDMGAFELGADVPVYGPRMAVGSRFRDVAGTDIFFADIKWLSDRGITRGCNPPGNDRFCPDEAVTRGQMAAFLVRAFGLPGGGGGGFVDDDGSVFEDDIARLAAAGITRGCNPPDDDRFCPGDSVTRAQMAAFLHRSPLD